MRNTDWTKNLFTSALALFCGGVFVCQSAFAAQDIGTIDDVYKYAWSENAGWIVFKVPQGNVTVTDTQITGYIWSPLYGWINLQPEQGGVTNTLEGDVSGTAWGTNLGWIDFDDASIDSSGFFWGYLDGDVIGKTTLNCGNTNSCSVFDFKVKTNWIPERFRDDYEGLYTPGGNAEEKYWWGPDRIRDEFRGHYDSGTTKLTFDNEYKKSLEHAIQIDMGVEGKVQEYAREDGRTKFAQYVPGRLGMESFMDDARDKIVYRREWVDRPNVNDYFTAAGKEDDLTDRQKEETDLYDKARQRIYEDTYKNDQAATENPNKTKGIGAGSLLRNRKEVEIQSVIQRRKRMAEEEKERKERFEKLRLELLGPERYQQVLEKEKERNNTIDSNTFENLMDNLFKYLETNIFNLFK